MALSLEDRWNIQELVNRFCHYSDYGDWERLRALYTEDIVLEMVGLDTILRGPDAQVIHAKHSFEGAGGKNRHYNHNLIIDEVSDAEAIASYYIHQFAATAPIGEIKINVTARMDDRVVRTPDGWRIAERKFRCDQTFALSADELAKYR